MLRFVLVFGIVVVAFYAFTATSFFQNRIFTPYLEFNTQLSAMILKGLGQEVTVRKGNELHSRGFPMEIHRGCEAIEPSVLFLAAVFGAPAALRKKIIGGVAGVLILAVLNLVRILTLYFAGAYSREFFDLIHVEVWQPAFILFALLLWLGWAVWATRVPKGGAPQRTPGS